MSEIKKHIAQARRFEFGRVHHYRDAEALYGKAGASDESAVALGRLCIKNGQLSLMKKRGDTLARLRRAAASSEPSFRRMLAIYIAHIDCVWDSESINLIYLAFQKNDCLAGYILYQMLEQLGDVVMENLSLPVSDRRALYLDCLRRSGRLGCLGASYALGCYYWERGQKEEALRVLTRAAEGGCFGAFKLLVWCCRSVGSDVYCLDMSAFLAHAKRLACDMNDVATAGYLADYLADAERGALFDLVAALRFHRKSFRMKPSGHIYVIFGERRWDKGDMVFRMAWPRFIRDDCLLSSEHPHFPIARTSNRWQVR